MFVHDGLLDDREDGRRKPVQSDCRGKIEEDDERHHGSDVRHLTRHLFGGGRSNVRRRIAPDREAGLEKLGCRGKDDEPNIFHLQVDDPKEHGIDGRGRSHERIEADERRASSHFVKNDAIQGDKDGELDDQEKDARKRIHAVLFIKREKCLRLFFTVILMLFLDLFDMRLDPLHQHLLFRAAMEKRIKDEPNKKRYENDREAQIMQTDRLIEINEQVQDRIFENKVIQIGHFSKIFTISSLNCRLVSFVTPGKSVTMKSFCLLGALRNCDLT